MTKTQANGAYADSADDILSLMDVETESVFVPMWNLTVRVRSIGAGERERLLKGSIVVEGKTQRFDPPTMRVKIVALAAVKADGTRLFTNDQVAKLGEKNAKAVDLVADVAMRLAGINDDTKDTAKDGDPNPLPETANDDSSTA